MKARYVLRRIRKTPAFEEICLSAFIWRERRQIGRFRECSDSGALMVDFFSPSEQADFADFICQWWNESNRQRLCDLRVRLLIEENPNFEVPLNVKIHCWVKYMVGRIEETPVWKWQTRSAKQLLRSF